MARVPKGFYGRGMGRKVRPRWWSFVNWLKGYKFGPVQRFRCCDHTTPFHYNGCPSATDTPESTRYVSKTAESGPERKGNG